LVILSACSLIDTSIMSLLRVLFLPGLAVLAATCEELLEAASPTLAAAQVTEAHVALLDE